MVKIAQTTIDNRRNRQSPGTCFKGSVSILKTLVIAKYAPIPVKISFINSPSSGWWKRRKPRVLVALAAFVLLGILLSGLRLSLHRRLALVISHSIVDSVAGHRSCGRTEERTPEATAGRGRSRLIHSLVDDGRVLLHDGRALRGIGFRGSRTGERTTAAEPTTTSCFSCCRNEKGDRNGRHNSFLHR